jgi:Na+/H+ antiporter NhaB
LLLYEWRGLACLRRHWSALLAALLAVLLSALLAAFFLVFFVVCVFVSVITVWYSLRYLLASQKKKLKNRDTAE